MADIKQAAKWIQEGRDVERNLYQGRWWATPYYPTKLTYEIVCADGRGHTLDTMDLLAEDWQIAVVE